MMNTVDEFAKKVGSRPQSRDSDRLKRTLACIGRLLFTHRLEIGLGVTAVAAPFVRPTVATKPSEMFLKAAGLCLALAGLGVRVWGAGFAGRHTRSSKIEGNKLAMAGPYAHVRNPIYFGSVILGFGIVLLIGDRRLFVPCALTFLVLYCGLIPAEEEFLRQKFRDEYDGTAGTSLGCFRGLKPGLSRAPSRHRLTGEQRLSMFLPSFGVCFGPWPP